MSSFFIDKLREFKYKDLPSDKEAIEFYKKALPNIGYKKKHIEEIAERFGQIRNNGSIADKIFLDDLFGACFALDKSNRRK